MASMASISVITLVLILDLLAFVLAIGAERRRSKAVVVQDGAGRSYCVYTTDAWISTWYGVAALSLLLVGQAVAMGASRCFCCGRALSPGRWRAFSGVCFVICWLTFVIAELCLLAGSVRNAYHTKKSDYFINGPPHCTKLRKGVFAAGAAFTFLTALFAELQYMFYGAAAAAAATPPIIQGGGIGMTST